jgi:hypothetical protein
MVEDGGRWSDGGSDGISLASTEDFYKSLLSQVPMVRSDF